MGRSKYQMPERFWRQVIKSPDGCWIWTGYRTRDGYGRIWFKTGLILAHRLAWILTHGKPPANQILHRCDNPPCVRPDHLFEGTQLENVADCVRKNRNRSPVGAKCHTAKLTETQVVEIRTRIACGVKPSQIAREYKMDPSTIQSLAKGESWKSVGGPIIERKTR